MISLVLAAYNEEKLIRSSISKSLSYLQKNFPGSELVIIDDGSTDSTWEILQEAAGKNPMLKIDKNPKNMGQGAAFRRAFSIARGDVIITNDCDLSYSLEDIPKLLSKMQEGYDVVVSSPLLPEGQLKNVPILRKLFSASGGLIYSTFISSEISCYTGAFRAYSRKAISSLKFESNGFEAQTEILWRCRQNGCRIGEIPSKLSFIEGRVSRFRPARVIPKHLLLLAKIVLNEKPK